MKLVDKCNLRARLWNMLADLGVVDTYQPYYEEASDDVWFMKEEE